MLMPDGYTIRFPGKDGPPGAHGSIAFKEKHWKIFQNDLLHEARSKLQATMGAWCRRGPQDLPPQKFKFEQQFEKGGKKTRIEVFKTRHVRFYGTTTDVDGKPMFLVTGVDVAKKTDQADRDILDAAGKAAHELIYNANDRQRK